MRKVKVAIVGSRSFTPILGNIIKQHSRTRSLINAAMKNLYEDQPVLSKIISGGADGADKYGEAYVNSQAYKSPVMTGMNVGVATQKQKYTRECDAIFVQFKNIADTIGFDIQLSNN